MGNRIKITKRELKIAGLVLAGFIIFGIVAPNRGVVVLEYLKVFISWPVVVGILGILFGITFKTELSEYLRSIGLIKFPGGEVRSNQLSSLGSREQEERKDEITLTEEEQENLAKELTELESYVSELDRKILPKS